MLKYNRNTGITQTPMVAAGDRVPKGGILARSNFTNDEGELAVGRDWGKEARQAWIHFCQGLLPWWLRRGWLRWRRIERRMVAGAIRLKRLG